MADSGCSADNNSADSANQDLRGKLQTTTLIATSLATLFGSHRVAKAHVAAILRREKHVKGLMTEAAQCGRSSIRIKYGERVWVVMHHDGDSLFHDAVLCDVEFYRHQWNPFRDAPRCDEVLMEYMHEHELSVANIRHVPMHEADWLWETVEEEGPPLESTITAKRSSPVGLVLGVAERALHWWGRAPPVTMDQCIKEDGAAIIATHPVSWVRARPGVWKKLLATGREGTPVYTVALGEAKLTEVGSIMADMTGEHFGVTCFSYVGVNEHGKVRSELVLSWGTHGRLSE